MAEPKKYDTPLLDELEKGAFPSFVTEIKRMAERKPMAADLLGQLEKSYRDKIGYWKHGGLVGVMGYGGGVIGRYSAKADEFPKVSHFHTIRVNQPSGWFYNTEKLRLLCDIWDNHGSGLTNMHGSTGDIVFLGTRTEELEPIFSELTQAGWDLGGSGSCMRTPSCCVGPGRCEWALYDTLAVTYQLTMDFQDEMHRPPFPYKFKFKMAGCPNDCVASIARADMSIIGTWRDDIKVDAAALKSEYIDKGTDIQSDVVEMCPTSCMKFDGETLDIDNRNCTKCMHCINVLHHALAPGDDRGACILVGSKAPIVEGALLSSVIVPFIKLDTPMEGEDAYPELMELIEKMWDFWGENGKNRERIGEMIQRIGLGNFLEEIEVDPIPEMIVHPRTNPYIFFEEYYEDDDEEDTE